MECSLHTCGIGLPCSSWPVSTASSQALCDKRGSSQSRRPQSFGSARLCGAVSMSSFTAVAGEGGTSVAGGGPDVQAEIVQTIEAQAESHCPAVHCDTLLQHPVASVAPPEDPMGQSPGKIPGVELAPGTPKPKGCSEAPLGGSVNFTLDAPGRRSVWLYLVLPEGHEGASILGTCGEFYLQLDSRTNRSGDTWHVQLSLPPGFDPKGVKYMRALLF
eukprot:s3222_g5.t1